MVKCLILTCHIIDTGAIDTVTLSGALDDARGSRARFWPADGGARAHELTRAGALVLRAREATVRGAW